ncbi:hypothetical protein J595_03374, partial [Acinetobacter sp. 1592897]
VIYYFYTNLEVHGFEVLKKRYSDTRFYANVADLVAAVTQSIFAESTC